MPNATVRANARTMSKANPPEHNDAALIALVNECIAAETALDKQNEAMDEAERQQRDIATPKGIFRTESDLQMGLFAGRDGIGKPYDLEDIELLRPLVRRKNREACSTVASFKEGQRADDILEQWRDWRTPSPRRKPSRATVPPQLLGTPRPTSTIGCWKSLPGRSRGPSMACLPRLAPFRILSASTTRS
jgi:hypothetical protein